MRLIIYGLSTGLVAAAAGAFAAAGTRGVVQVVIWVCVTGFLVAGAVWLADPALAVLGRYLWPSSAPHRPDGGE